MSRVRLTARVAALAATCAVAVPSAIAAAHPSAIAAAHPSAIAAAHPSVSAASATVRVGSPAPVAATSTAQGFLGIATSFSTISALAGPAGDQDLAFQHLLKNLSPDAPFLLRLGGVSADTSWWPVAGIKKLPWLHTLTPRWGEGVRALLRALGGTAILGINLEEPAATNPVLARGEVAGFDRYVGANLIDAFELGNEPEYWPLSVVNGGRGRDTIAAYGKKFTQVAAQLGGVPLAGPASVGTVWLSELGTVLSHLPSHLKLATVHLYPLKNCSAAAHPLLTQLLARSSIQGLATSAHAMVKAAAAHGEPLRVDELNAITCGGRAGVSNSFGEALWALNVLPALWGAGVQGVNFQTVDGLLNQVISARHTGSGWRVAVQPVYYGLLAFAEAAPAGSRLLRVSAPGLPGFYQFAVRAPDGSERVVLTNAGSVARTVGVRAASARGTGSVSLLRAGSLTATTGTTLGGRHLSARTGELTGSSRVSRVRRDARGEYSVRVPAHAAAILTLPR